jgi:hypothetical protein
MTFALGAKKSSGVRNCASINTHNATDNTKHTAGVRATHYPKAYNEDTAVQCNSKTNMDAIFPCIVKLEDSRSRIQPPR